MELYELPKDRPIATRWAGSGCALIAGRVDSLADAVVGCSKAQVLAAEGGFGQD